ncbi:RNA polymerase sigma factor [Novipirellula artificiosorum]|uniref:ECF RNA polymerase sigma factor SigH n=1 Tax=Novipirellula artificiosorum TaxID=2528016 RepID=A0A5C6DE26_9BACT|nr:sigma-70 family RNA polymerase sigma factor [Novipirellula artificiosorum]TWU34445.1 ECF RNA polymerase sigma factor SigH [Novipirellula artificiosorum]
MEILERNEPKGLSDAKRALLAQASDEDLLDAWDRDHQGAALAVLIQRYSAMVLSVCRRRCRCDADADDAFQSTFLYLAKNARKIRHPERIGGWLHRVAQRAAVAACQIAKRETEPMVEPTSTFLDPFEQLPRRHEAMVLDEELADLPEHYRSALVMHVYEGRTLEQVANDFGTSTGSIRGRLQRGKKILARRLRSRGVVPVFAFAAATVTAVASSTASAASQSLVGSTTAGDMPDPPIDLTVLDKLLGEGVRVGTSVYVATVMIAGTLLLGLVTVSAQCCDCRRVYTEPSP